MSGAPRLSFWVPSPRYIARSLSVGTQEETEVANDLPPALRAQGHYTPVTKKLWVDRLSVAEKHKSDRPEQPVTHKPPEETRVVYPFSSNSVFKELYRNPWNYIRIGCILEDLDSLAGNIAFQHCARPGSPPPLLVTASVDEIHLRRPIAIEHDITVTGQVVWTGTSALDIQMKVWQESDLLASSASASSGSADATADFDAQPSLVALFSFVHLDAETKRPAPAVQLLPRTEEDKKLAAQRQALADARRAARSAQAAGARCATSPEAMKWVKPLLNEARVQVELPALAASDAIPIPLSVLENTFMTQPQHQNMHGRVFGGFLMRRAFELGFATTYMFAGTRPDFVMVDEVSFKKPVDIGNLLRLKSKVIYTQAATDRSLLFVEVDASVAKPEQREVASTNTFLFVFSVDQLVKRVLPTTEEEALRAFECHQAADRLQAMPSESRAVQGSNRSARSPARR